MKAIKKALRDAVVFEEKTNTGVKSFVKKVGDAPELKTIKILKRSL